MNTTTTGYPTYSSLQTAIIRKQNDGARVIADIFINNDEEPGTFYRAFIGDNGVFQKGNGGVDFADFNNDGFLDFALHGEGGEGTGEPTSGDIWQCISHVYINQKDGSFLEKISLISELTSGL
ncbi:MAG: hypothetical protein HC906_05675 [Bacteroidales bacterium]|nr:hypothetical protein [Bacteroidales bacterium]